MVQRYRVLFLASSHFWQIVLVFTSGVGMLRFAANLRSLRVLSTLNSASLTSRPLTGVMASSTETSNGQPTVGIIVIGDEILKGQTQDTNSHFLVRRLFTLGARVRRISVIPDDLDVISKEVQDFSKEYTHVITSGGIGPTHDDVTFEGVARAFGEHIFPHPELVAVCKDFFGTDDLESPKLKLAFIPESSTLHYGTDKTTGEKSRYPVVKVRNVYMFPGIPRLFEMAFIRLEDLFRNPNKEFFTQELFLAADEFSITPVLNAANEQFKNRVTIGSYPDFYNSYYKVKLTLESESSADIEAVTEFLRTHLPERSFVEFDHDPVTHAADQVYHIADGSDAFSVKVRQALRVIEEAFCQYPQDEVCVGFNGGKDCTALLHLVYAVVCKRKATGGTGIGQLAALYIRKGQPFPEIELFIRRTKSRYRLDVVVVDGRIKDALTKLKQTHPGISAVLMGTRRSDPNSNLLKDFSPTDGDWPPYMRVNPILDWTYSDVWAFIRRLSLPYCVLYDLGYTSLGNMENTHPNPQLKQVDKNGIVSYRPAYELSDQDSERAGRN